MIRQLDPVETRVLGSLLEKRQTTPESYPLTLNSLLLACNQKTSREPVTDYSEQEIEAALARLQQDKFVWKVTGGRAARWDHNLGGVLEVSRASRAILTVLFLRGPQTIAELRTRTERLHEFETPDEIEETLRVLASREEPYVRHLERQPGQKETRWAHLLSGEPVYTPSPVSERAPRAQSSAGSVLEERITELENTVAELRAEVESLKRLIAG